MCAVYAAGRLDGGVRRAVTYALAWLAAAAVAVTVAYQGVGVVTDRVTDDRPAALTADDLESLAAAPPDATTTIASAVAPSSTPTTLRTTGTTVTDAPAPTTPTTAAPATTTTTAPPEQAETRTYNLVGGSVALRFAASGVTVLWANPNAGFEVDVEPEGNGVQVDFESESHRSRVEGWWDNGPVDRVREDADD